MNEKTSSVAVRLNALFTILAGIALFIEYLVGVPGYPKVPPGPFILVGAGVLVLLLAARFRWIIVLGLIAPAFITIGGIAQGGSWAMMGNLGHVSFFISTWLQWICLVLALVCGIIGLTQLLRRSKDSALLVR